MALRWKMLVGLGAALIVLACIVDWPPPADASLPHTKPLLLFLGAVVGAAGLIVALTREK
jgi:hypothetical protein